MTILLEPDPAAAEAFRFAVGSDVSVLDSIPATKKALVEDRSELLLVVGPDIELSFALDIAETLRLERPEVGVVLLRHRMDVTVLAQSLRAGIREVVNPDDLAALGEACRRSLDVSRRMLGVQGHDQSSTHARVTVVFSAKGGCGKTTMATNLAVALAAGGRQRVCLVDLDLAFGDVAIALQLLPARTIVDAISMEGKLDEQGVKDLVTPHSAGLDTICAPLEPGEAERIPVPVVVELLRVLRGMYDHVIIDTPPAFTEHVLAAFDGADAYVLLATLDIPALKNLRLTLDMLDLLGYSRDSWQVVLNRSDSKVGLSVDDVEQTLKTPIAAQVPSSRAVSASINRGVPIVLEEPQHPVSVAIRDLADRRLRGDDGATTSQTRRGDRPQRKLSLLRRGRG